jgi:hypothetical protein
MDKGNKTEIRESRRRKSMRTLTSIFMILVMATFLTVTPTRAASDLCIPATGTAHASATGPTSAAGKANFTIFGQTYKNVDFTLNFTLTPNADGTISETSQHTFYIKDSRGHLLGTILTQDVGKAFPTPVPGVYDLTLKLAISGGTGLFVNACGYMDDKGVLDARTVPTVDSVLNGKACYCR